MNDLGKGLVIAGVAIALLGLALWSGIGRGWFGRLPGDIHVSGEKFSFYFPIVTCVLLSVVVSALLWFVRKM